MEVIGALQEVNLGTGRTAVSVSGGSSHTCAILDNGSLKCWGSNSYGQLGIGTTDAVAVTTPQEVNLGTGRTAISVAVGGSHTCAILDDGSLKCWGRNNYHQIGTGTQVDVYTPQVVNLGTGRTVISVGVGSSHTCAILDDGILKCWGFNLQGQLGTGTQVNAPTPQIINLGTGRTAVSVSLGSQHTCAILDDGNLKCWGSNSYGQIAGSGYSFSPRVVDLGVGRTAISINAGYSHTCAVLDNSSLACWGQNSQGQLGVSLDDLSTNTDSPVYVNLSSNSTIESLGTSYYGTCVSFSNGEIKCWGYYRNILMGTTGFPENVPTLIGEAFEKVPQVIELGSEHSCAIFDGDLNCWGYNIQGQLGIGISGTGQQELIPHIVDLGIGRSAVSVSAAYGHTCAILDNGSLKCWGYNFYGQLGIGTSETGHQCILRLNWLI